METVSATAQASVHPLTWDQVYELVGKLPKSGKFYGVPRGGAIVAGLTGRACGTPEEADFILDDIVDSGATREKWLKMFPSIPFIGLIDKTLSPRMGWVQFPWEQAVHVDLQENVRRLLEGIGEDPNREGLRDTPRRVVKALLEVTSGNGIDPASVLGTTFSAEGYDQMVICRGIEFASTCEHHLLPFTGICHVGYIPKDRVVGLSKIPRLVEAFSRRLQIQEKLTEQIAKTMETVLNPEGVGVIMEAQHLCVRCRGIRKVGSSMITSALKGVFRIHAVRSEFITLAKA